MANKVTNVVIASLTNEYVERMTNAVHRTEEIARNQIVQPEQTLSGSLSNYPDICQTISGYLSNSIRIPIKLSGSL